MKETLEEAAELGIEKWRNDLIDWGEENNSLLVIENESDYILGFKHGAAWQQERSYSEEDMINASKYGYNFHKTTQFPNQEFEDSCINNTKQWLTTFKKKS